MVPTSSAASSKVSPSEAKAASPAIASTDEQNAEPAKAPAKALSPQERKNKKLQQTLEKSLTEALPVGTKPSKNGFITSLMPDINGKDLTVTLDSDWYQLEPDQQEAIASTLWNQRTNLKFQQLTLKDLKGKTIARPPVVGDQMVILRR